MFCEKRKESCFTKFFKGANLTPINNPSSLTTVPPHPDYRYYHQQTSHIKAKATRQYRLSTLATSYKRHFSITQVGKINQEVWEAAVTPSPPPHPLWMQVFQEEVNRGNRGPWEGISDLPGLCLIPNSFSWYARSLLHIVTSHIHRKFHWCHGGHLGIPNSSLKSYQVMQIFPLVSENHYAF